MRGENKGTGHEQTHNKIMSLYPTSVACYIPHWNESCSFTGYIKRIWPVARRGIDEIRILCDARGGFGTYKRGVWRTAAASYDGDVVRAEG